MRVFGNGFQSDQLEKALNLLGTEIENGSKIALAFTGNMISSGMRDIISELVKNKKVHTIVTNGAGIEEDLIKSFGDYNKVEFDTNDKELSLQRLYRIGNLAVSDQLYEKFDNFLWDNYEKAISDPECDQTPGSISKILARKIDDSSSYLYWADRNNIPIFCPTFHDGAIGDYLHELREVKLDYRIDFILENVKLSKLLSSFERCGSVILGGGTSKHFLLNCSIKRGGMDWKVSVSTAIPFDGSDSGGNTSEAKTWGKIKKEAVGVDIFSEATLAFPYLAEAMLKS